MDTKDETTNKVARSELWNKIYSIVSKLKLAETQGGDAYDHNSITTELESALRSRLESDKCKGCPNKEFYEQNTARIMDSVEPDKKSAEECLIECQGGFERITFQIAVSAIKMYHSQFTERVSDETIEKYAKSFPGNTGNPILDMGVTSGFIEGAKAMRDGKITC